MMMSCLKVTLKIFSLYVRDILQDCTRSILKQPSRRCVSLYELELKYRAILSLYFGQWGLVKKFEIIVKKSAFY